MNAHSSADIGAEPKPLPRGRHKLPSSVVHADQRRRLLNAMLSSVAERGYEATTVPAIVAAARVSTNTFYTFFSDKLDCFLGVCNELAPELLSATVNELPDDSWESAMRAGVHQYLTWWQERPAFARAYLVELPTAGRRAIEQRQAAYEPYASIFAAAGARARREHPELAPLRPMTPWVITWAVTDLIAAEVLAGRTAGLESLEDDVMWLIERLLSEPA